MNRDLVLRIRLGRRSLAVLLAVILLPGAWEAVSETLTVTTYYPSPAGFYRRLTSTARTILARDSGGVGIGTADPGSAKLAVMGGRVGIGTSQPAAQLDVAGDVRVSGGASLGGVASAADVLAGGKSAVTEIVCGEGLICKKSRNLVTINLETPCRPDGTCSAAVPACGQTTTGTDNCGGACQKVGPDCRYTCGSCTIAWKLNACAGGGLGAVRSTCTPNGGAAQSLVMGGSGTCSTPSTTYTYTYETCDPDVLNAGAACASRAYTLSCTATNVPIN